MDRRERANDFLTAVNAAIQGAQSELWTAMPGIVQSYDPAQNTAVVQLSIKAQVQNQEYVWQDQNLPVLPDVVVVWPGGGGYSMRFPLAKDDEVLVVFASRCINAWWAQGGIQPQEEQRMHDLSDGFCIPRVWSKPNTTAINKAVFTADDGSVSIELDKAAGKVNVIAPGGMFLNGAPVQTA